MLYKYILSLFYLYFCHFFTLFQVFSLKKHNYAQKYYCTHWQIHFCILSPPKASIFGTLVYRVLPNYVFRTAKRHIRVHAYLHSERMVLLTVENAFDEKRNEKTASTSPPSAEAALAYGRFAILQKRTAVTAGFSMKMEPSAPTLCCGRRNSLLIPSASVIMI